MASIISHPAVAFSLLPWFQRGQLSALAWQWGAVCTIVPDADVIGFHFGIPYGAMFGHRGFTHSLFFAALLSVLLVRALRPQKQTVSQWRLFCYFFFCTASHGILDAMTTGGLGVAFFAPFWSERYFLAWRPIQVSPLSVHRFLSERGFAVLESELRWVWLPALAVALAGYGFQSCMRKA